MRIKGMYVTRPAIIQPLTPLPFLLVRAILLSVISTGLLLMTHGLQADVTQDTNLMRLIQFISAIYTFLLPSIAMAQICSDSPHHCLSVKKTTGNRIWILTLTYVSLFFPVINSLGLLSKQMGLPALITPIEEWIQAQETLAKQLTMILLPSGSAWVILASLIVIAVTAGITEEFLFKGALQRVIGKWTSSPHTTIWVAAILFSAFHLQSYGFLPWMVLGTYLGYLLYWSKSIQIPVFTHFINNTFAIIRVSDSYLRDNGFITGDIPAEYLLDFCLIVALSFLLFVLVNRRLRRLL